MANNSVVAYICMGQYWCPDHCEASEDEIADGYVTEITEFCIMVGEGAAEGIEGACCHGCGESIMEGADLV